MSVYHRFALAACFGEYVRDLIARGGSELHIEAIATRAAREARAALDGRAE